MEALVDMREISLSTLEATGIVPHSEMSNDDATDHFEFFLRGAYYEITTQTFHKMQKLKNRSATKSTKLANRSRVVRIQLHLETVIKDLEIDNDIKDWGFDGFILSGIHQHPHRLPEAELRQISELFENFDGLNCLRAMQALLLLINLPRDKGGSETTSSAAPFVAAAASFWHSVKNGGGIDRRFKKPGSFGHFCLEVVARFYVPVKDSEVDAAIRALERKIHSQTPAYSLHPSEEEAFALLRRLGQGFHVR